MHVLYVAEVDAGPGDVAHGGDHVVLQLTEHQLLAKSHLHCTYIGSDNVSDTVSAIVFDTVFSTVSSTVSDIASSTVSDIVSSTVSDILSDTVSDTVSDIVMDNIIYLIQYQNFI